MDLDLGYNVKGIQPNYVWDITKSAQYFAHKIESIGKKFLDLLSYQNINHNNMEWIKAFNKYIVENSNDLNDPTSLQIKLLLNSDILEIFNSPKPFKYITKDEYMEIVNSVNYIKNNKIIRQKFNKDNAIQKAINDDLLIRKDAITHTIEGKRKIAIKNNWNLNLNNIYKENKSIYNDKFNFVNQTREINLEPIEINIEDEVNIEEFFDNTKKLELIHGIKFRKDNNEDNIISEYDKSINLLENVEVVEETIKTSNIIELKDLISRNITADHFYNSKTKTYELKFIFKDELLDKGYENQYILNNEYDREDIVFMLNTYSTIDQNKLVRLKEILKIENLSTIDIISTFKNKDIVIEESESRGPLKTAEVTHDNVFLYFDLEILKYNKGMLLDISNEYYILNENSQNLLFTYYNDYIERYKDVNLIRQNNTFYPLRFVTDVHFMETSFVSSIIDLLRRINSHLKIHREIKIVDYVNPIIYEKDIILYIVFELFASHSVLWLFYPYLKIIYVIDSLKGGIISYNLIDIIKRKVAEYNRNKNITIKYDLIILMPYEQKENNCIPITLFHALNIIYQKDYRRENYLKRNFIINIDENNIRKK